MQDVEKVGGATPDGAGAGLPRRLLGVLPTAAWLAVALALAWFLWPTTLGGCTTLTIVSGHSMEPTYVTGDLVVARCGEPQLGDAVVYSPEEVPGARVIHRIVGGSADAGWTVQGDNNDFLDPWTPENDEILGIATLHVPAVGRLAGMLLSPVLWGSLVFVAVAMLLWPRDEPQHRADDDADDPDDVGDRRGDDPEPLPGDGALVLVPAARAGWFDRVAR